MTRLIFRYSGVVLAPLYTGRNVIQFYNKHGFSQTLARMKLAIRREILRPCITRFVEMTGNRWKLDGCVFLLDSPLILGYTKCFLVEGIYEIEMRRLIKAHLLRDRPTIELGASIGVVSCITNTLLRNPQQHLVVEANPDLIPLLEANRRKNECRFAIRQAAIAYGADAVVFFLHKKCTAGSVHCPSDRQVTVPTVSLAHLIKETGFDRINLIVDIECAEISLIESESDVLSRYVEMLFIEMHPGPIPEKTIEHVLRRLRNIGFQIIGKEEGVYVYKNTNCLFIDPSQEPL